MAGGGHNGGSLATRVAVALAALTAVVAAVAACSLGFDGDEFRRTPDAGTDGSSAANDGATIDGSINPGTDGSPPPGNDAGLDPPIDAGPCVDTQTNSLHCGACGHSCFGGDCMNGQCRPIAIVDGVSGAAGVVAAGGKIYFGGNGRIRRVDPDGTNAVDVISSANVRYMAASATHIYWADGTAGGIQRWAIGAASDARETVVSGVSAISGVALSNDHVYFSRYAETGSVERVLYDGGAREALLDPYAYPEDVDFSVATNELIVGGDGEDELIVVAGAGSGASRTLVNGSGPVAMAIDGPDVFFVQQENDTIQRIPLAGGQKQFLASAGGRPCGITTTADSIYWANCVGNEIMRLAK